MTSCFLGICGVQCCGVWLRCVGGLVNELLGFPLKLCFVSDHGTVVTGLRPATDRRCFAASILDPSGW